MNHNLLPTRIQTDLKAAASTGDKHLVSAAIARAANDAPRYFHSDKTVAGRMFYHQPRQNIPNAGWLMV